MDLPLDISLRRDLPCQTICYIAKQGASDPVARSSLLSVDQTQAKRRSMRAGVGGFWDNLGDPSGIAEYQTPNGSSKTLD